MQFKKDEIKENILAAARTEFIKKGFEKASIRSITTAAKTSKSNVYNYFPDKDALFAAIVHPTISAMNSGFSALHKNSTATAEPYSIAAQKDVIMKIMAFVYTNSEDLKLLLFHSSGSSLSGFKADVTRSLALVLSAWVRHAAPHRDIPAFFIDMISGFYIGSIEQMLAKGIAPQQAALQFDPFLRFVYGGWDAVLNS